MGILVAVPGEVGPDRFELLKMPVPLPLQNLDRCTGVNMMQALQFSLSIPGLSDLRREAKCVVHAYTADRAGANDTCLDARAALLAQRGDGSSPSIRLPCFAHVAATIQGRAFAPVETYITGIIAIALTHASPGQTLAFRNMLIHVLMLGTQVHDFVNHPRAAGWAS